MWSEKSSALKRSLCIAGATIRDTWRRFEFRCASSIYSITQGTLKTLGAARTTPRAGGFGRRCPTFCAQPATLQVGELGKFDELLRVYDERFRRRYGSLPPQSQRPLRRVQPLRWSTLRFCAPRPDAEGRSLTVSDEIGQPLEFDSLLECFHGSAAMTSPLTGRRSVTNGLHLHGLPGATL